MTKELTVSMRHCQGKKWGIDRRKPDSDACGWPLTVLALTAFGVGRPKKAKMDFTPKHQ
jgi:hypothetical protein